MIKCKLPQAALARGALSVEILQRWLSVVNIPVIGALAKLSPAFRQGPWLPPLQAVLTRNHTRRSLCSDLQLDMMSLHSAGHCRAPFGAAPETAQHALAGIIRALHVQRAGLARRLRRALLAGTGCWATRDSCWCCSSSWPWASPPRPPPSTSSAATTSSRRAPFWVAGGLPLGFSCEVSVRS